MVETVRIKTLFGRTSEIDFRAAVGNFSCKDKNVEDFLKTKAFDFDKRNVARTYLLVDSDRVGSVIPEIMAYFTLSIKSLTFQGKVSKTMIKEIDGFSKQADSVGSVLIGQLGKDVIHGDQISGKTILDIAIKVIYTIFDSAGCRITFLECLPIEKVIAFYRSNQFVSLQINEINGLLQMVRFL
jgi:hypothetical protein